MVILKQETVEILKPTLWVGVSRARLFWLAQSVILTRNMMIRHHVMRCWGAQISDIIMTCGGMLIGDLPLVWVLDSDMSYPSVFKHSKWNSPVNEDSGGLNRKETPL